MVKQKNYLDWCVVRLGEDMNWWVEEISDEVHWDVDGLGIIDPRQVAHVLDLLDPLQEYGLQMDFIDDAFFTFAIEKELKEGRVRLKRVRTSLVEADQPLFALPDVMDDEKGPYADFLDHITRLRVQLLNDLIDFKQQFTVEELEEEIREAQNADFMEGRAVHFFTEISQILEYVPAGFALEEDEEAVQSDEDPDLDGVPDLEEDTKELDGDDSLRWDEEEEAEEDDDDEESDRKRGESDLDD
ncbi:MAG: hypothetical protein ACFCU4_08915 [Puniceicoccaceae bacterium]